MSERERQTPHDIIYMWNLKYNTNGPTYATETGSQDREQPGKGCQGGGEGWSGRLGWTDVSFHVLAG